MKVIKLLIALIFISPMVFGQVSKSFAVPLVTEKPALDTMVQQFKTFNKRNGFKNDSCFIIAVYRRGNDALFSIHFLDSIYKSQLYTDQSNIFKKNRFKYFKFQNNFVLLYNDDEPYNLIKKTSFKHSFQIILRQDTSHNLRKDGGYLYIYKNGKFRLMGDLKKSL